MFAKCRILIILICLLALCGCSAESRAKDNDIFLCDYKNVDIIEEMYSVSEADLNTAMTMYAISTDEVLEDYTDLTDAIVLHYYGYESVNELRERALWDIVSHRVIDAVYSQILLTSHMDFNSTDSHFENFYSNRMSSIDYLSKQENSTVSAFLENNYQMTETAFKEAEIDFYVTVCILKEILDIEGNPVLQADIDCSRSRLAQDLGCSVEETYKIVLDEDLIYTIAESKMSELILEWYEQDITDAYNTVKQSF